MPHYTRYGYQGDEVDIFDLLLECSKTAFKVFNDLKHGRNPSTNLVTLPKLSTGTTEYVSRSKALRELIEIGLIRKVKKNALITQDGIGLAVPTGTYLINPKYLIPRSNDDFDIVNNYWQQLEIHHDNAGST